jgi:predicted small secreted protein
MKALAAFFSVVAVLLLSGCNTVAGAGQDMTLAGTAIEQTASDAEAK